MPKEVCTEEGIRLQLLRLCKREQGLLLRHAQPRLIRKTHGRYLPFLCILSNVIPLVAGAHNRRGAVWRPGGVRDSGHRGGVRHTADRQRQQTAQGAIDGPHRLNGLHCQLGVRAALDGPVHFWVWVICAGCEFM